MIAGLGNKVVIFYDMSDLVLSFTPWIFMAFFGFVASTFDDGFVKSTILWIFVYIIPALLVIASIFKSINDNKSILIGLIVGPFKLFFSLLGIVAFVNCISAWLEDKRSFKDAIVATIILSITGWLTKKIINGEEVYLKKGWLIPQEYSEEAEING